MLIENLAAENKELVVHPVSIDTTVLLKEIQNTFLKSETGKQFHIRIAPGAQQIEFISDRTLLTRVLSNMVKNALEASVPGDIIIIGVERLGEEIQFSVHNPGFIPHEVQLQIFQRSFSTKGAGRGLGTYGMRLLSERYLKGKVSFTSSEDQGTTFTARYHLILN
jgi:signal transduction histidine kinase